MRLATVGLLLVACADPVGSPQTGPIPTNGLLLDDQAIARLTTEPLGSGWLDDLAVTEDGRALADYLVLCALGRGEELAGAHGHYELAPEWRADRCDEACQRWISACILAHTNAWGEPVELWARGPHPALPPADSRFTFQEAAFYGQLFADEPELYGCIGTGLAAGGIDSAEVYLSGRLCTANRCAIVSTGLCSLETTSLEVAFGAACVEESEPGIYTHCHTGDSREGWPRTSPTVAEVMTVYLQP